LSIIINNISKSFLSKEARIDVLKSVNLKIPLGDTISIMGDSGCGKSTLLHTIAGLEPPDCGEILINDIDIWKIKEKQRLKIRRENIGIIFQQFNLIPTLNIESNVFFHSKIIKKFDKSFCFKLIEKLGLNDILKRYPEQISGGQQQRVAIARAIAAKPMLLIADEPTGNLDEGNTEIVLGEVESIIKNIKTTLIIATHSEFISKKYNRRFILESGSLKKI
tara:strand:+ start:1090 stop:1752 length:663 start_codon:yes stop_codon:yes gene_type:complete